MALHRLPGQDVEADAADAGGGAGEVPVDERPVEPDGLEDLGPGVGMHRRDAHLRQHLEQALADAGDDVGRRLLHRRAGRQLAGLDHGRQRLEQQVGVDGAGPVAEETGHVVDLAGLARLHHDARPQSRPPPDQVVVDGRHGQQRRHRHPLVAGGPVGEDDHRHAEPDGGGGFGAEAVDGLGQPLGAFRHRPGAVEGLGVEHVVVDVAQFEQLVVLEDGLLHDQLVGVVRRLLQQVELRADGGLEAHDDALPDRVDGRVGDLGEALLEVAEQRWGPIGQHGQRHVAAHRPVGLLGLGGQRRDEDPHVLRRPAEGQLAGTQRVGAAGPGRDVGQVVEADDVLVVPGGVGAAGGDLGLDLAIGEHLAPFQIDHEQPAGPQPALGLDQRRLHREGPGLGGQDDPAVGGDHPPAGAEAVAVEGGADDPPVGEGHRCRPVPRLHQAGVVAEEPLDLVAQIVAPVEGLGDQHHQGVGERPAGHDQQLHDVVEGGGVGPALLDDGQQVADVAAQQLRFQLGVAGPHPVAIALQGVDLAVVGQHPVGVGQLPAREGVGREAGVDQGQGGLEPLVDQVGVEVG